MGVEKKPINNRDQIKFAGYTNNGKTTCGTVWFPVVNVNETIITCRDDHHKEFFRIHRRQVTAIKRAKQKIYPDLWVNVYEDVAVSHFSYKKAFDRSSLGDTTPKFSAVRYVAAKDQTK